MKCVQYCVNSLRDECREFFAIHGRDGRDLRTPARFPCYYSPEKNDSVVTKFNRGNFSFKITHTKDTEETFQINF